MAKNGLKYPPLQKWSKMVKNGQKWPKMAKNGQKPEKWSIFGGGQKRVKKGSKMGSKMGSFLGGSKWGQKGVKKGVKNPKNGLFYQNSAPYQPEQNTPPTPPKKCQNRGTPRGLPALFRGLEGGYPPLF